ncbi:hypothetical protein JWJ90_13310 [Desulfobulbus rhabdoformis]|uniref:hypothetical protein n=1 Tax=Desulfobulbus rhabdoformis TaxID=34032 RepID=UPI0019653FD5|nr:hypothetical protein [Desulfobulbus rhabdoformis]MBM9615258.1 hypothetical protein [Desulfobulbus rhabdoformis]
MSTVPVNITCPYCEFINTRHVDLKNMPSIHGEICYCDCEDGGCDRRFVVDYKVKIETEVRSIDGEKEKV